MDKEKSKLVDIYGSNAIRVERTDEYGRILTPKEAFRLFSHKLHGTWQIETRKAHSGIPGEAEGKTSNANEECSDTPSLSVEKTQA